MLGKQILETQRVSCGYGKMRVVNEVSLKLHEGEITLVMGPNGSGKSTLVKSVVGLVDIFDGHIMFDGTDITRSRTEKVIRMGISYVPQVSNIFVSLSVHENLEIGSILLQPSLREEAINKVYELFPELHPKGKELANTLSGGERQILAIAKGLIGKPRILILDEPTAGLAPKIAKNVISRISEIRDKGVSVLLVEQNARAALEIADTGHVLVAGSKIAEGTKDQIARNEEVVRLFLGGKRENS
ncbi:MAG: ABC transporter ATP-binding protein [Candidatus Bathyarchaeia archaeon]|jgi:branched-chain amino acid transport system ATP-binding protein